MSRVTIFHTSDLHNKLTPDLADQLNDLKDAHPNSLMFDSGDAIWAGNIYWRPGGEPILDLMNSVPYDAMCMGNREFHFLQCGIKAKTSRARFPILSANLNNVRPHVRPGHVVPDASSRTCSPSPFAAFDRDNLRITVFGLSIPCITERMFAKKVSDYYFAQPIEAARDIVPALRKECDMVVALTHIGLKHDIELAEQVPGINLILGGHTHAVAEERVGGSVILHSGHHAHFVRRVDVEFHAGKVTVETELIPLGKA